MTVTRGDKIFLWIVAVLVVAAVIFVPIIRNASDERTEQLKSDLYSYTH